MSLPQVDPTQYPQLLADKAQALQQHFALFSPPELEIFPSEPSHYRMRAEFRLWHQDEDLYYVMFDTDNMDARGKPARVRMDTYSVANQLINRLMPALLDAIRHWPQLRHKLFQVEFLTSTTDQAVISLIYHRQLDDTWEEAAHALRQQLAPLATELHLIGRARKQKKVVTQDYVIEKFVVAGRTLQYQQVETTFTQPNASVCQHMLSWAQEVTQGLTGDLLELYCGNANFSLALAENFPRILATEISKTSVKSAAYNLELNQIANLQVAPISSETLAQALAGELAESRKIQALKLADYQFSTVLVDPPRAGLDEATLQQVSSYKNLLYISCNPETLAANLHTLTRTHVIKRWAFFDQFPYTHHAEIGVFLQPR
ncbi:tRNA (uracil-5-)-methyltransferase [Allopseudospirillum japonicum]|uniref:tRNA/tmRNA (uracil-C(5))-methyltransferase n=1 Tax=Allopseudospirillum japonicum TaxID=64971 RepID=A0A1H6RMA1_9GAMM|nr:tRNA (uridine(54)-C5)-methyltransferase TrmA [Allopseudospirillum japonicum]SEI56909.1 tRNA (uracil-5-)-methyltransferase [Allopseudospirillum japonicum]